MRTPANALAGVNLRVDAVIAQLRMPADALAAVQPGDLIDLEPAVAGGLLLQFAINGTTVALATVREIDGRLVATIIESNLESKLRRVDQWKLRKPAGPAK